MPLASKHKAFIHYDNRAEDMILSFGKDNGVRIHSVCQIKDPVFCPLYFDVVCGRVCLSGSFLPFTEPVGHVCGCNVCVGCVLRPGSHCASAITGYPERKESMGGGGRGGREGESGRLACVHWSSG